MAELLPTVSTRLDAACRKAVELWGADAQWRMLQEESAELIAAVNQLDRGRPGALEKLIRELADVTITLRQAELMVGSVALEAAVEEKLARLEGRIAEAEVKRG